MQRPNRVICAAMRIVSATGRRPLLPNSGRCILAYLCAALDAVGGHSDPQFSPFVQRGARRSPTRRSRSVERTRCILSPDQPPMGELFVKRAWGIGPVTCCGRRAGGTVLPAFPRRCRVSCRCAVRGQAGAPAAVAPVRARAKTNELEAGKRRPRIGSEESLGGLWLWVARGVRGSGGVVSHPPIRRPPGGGGSP